MSCLYSHPVHHVIGWLPILQGVPAVVYQRLTFLRVIFERRMPESVPSGDQWLRAFRGSRELLDFQLVFTREYNGSASLMQLSQTIDSLPSLNHLVLKLPDTAPPFPGEALGFMFRLGRSQNAIESRGGGLNHRYELLVLSRACLLALDPPS